MGRGATCWPSSSLTSGWVAPLAFSLPELMGRRGGLEGWSLTADRIVSNDERLQKVTSGGLWFDLVIVVIRASSAVEGAHRSNWQNNNSELTRVSPVRGLSDDHKNTITNRIFTYTSVTALLTALCCGYYSFYWCMLQRSKHWLVLTLIVGVLTHPGLGDGLLCDRGVLWNLCALGPVNTLT